MASYQERREREERDEEVERQAADDVKEVGLETQPEKQEDGTGNIGNIIQSIAGTLGQAKEAVLGKHEDETAEKPTSERVHEVEEASGQKYEEAKQRTQEAKEARKEYSSLKAEEMKEKARETKQFATQKAGEYRDYAADKTSEAKDWTAGKMKETKDSATEKLGEYKDYAAEKEKETKDSTLGKVGDYKDCAAEKAKEPMDSMVGKVGEYKVHAVERAKEGTGTATGKLSELKGTVMDFLTGKKEETKEKVEETGVAAKEHLRGTAEAGEAEEEARRKEEEEMRLKGHETKGDKDNNLDRTRAADGAGEEVLAMVDVEAAPPGETASYLKESDNMAGQTFKDAGGVGCDGGAGLHRVKLEKK